MKGVIQHYSLPVLSGALLTISFPGLSLFPLAWVALAPLFWQTAELAWLPAARRFFVAGLVFHVLLLQWLTANVMWAGGWALWGYVFLSAYLAVFWALFAAIWRWIGTRSSYLGGAATAAILWIAMEHVQGTLFSGFGWSSLGYSQGPDLPLLQFAALGGGIGLSGLLVGVNALIGLGSRKPRKMWWRFAAAAALLIAAHAGGYALLDSPEEPPSGFSVGVFQSSFPLEMKWDPEYRLEMVENAAGKSRALSMQYKLDLMIWPEALVVSGLDDTDIRSVIESYVTETRTPLFTGSARIDRNLHYNSGYLIRPSGGLEEFYDKIHLAPFGEYAPFSEYIPFLDSLVPGGNLSAGDTPKNFGVGDRVMGPLICFEVIFPDMSAKLRTLGADFLVVITNLAWFGQSSAIPQELAIAQMRAVENRLPLVQAANTGISGVFDPWGRFTPTAGVVRRGTLYSLESADPRENVMRRLIDVHLLPDAVEHPLPWGPGFVPRAALFASFILIGYRLLAYSLGKKN